MEELKSKVLTFIEENQSFEGILSETYNQGQQTSESLLLQLKLDCSSDVSDCVNILKNQAKRASCPLDLLAAESIAKRLVKEVFSGCHGNHQQFINHKQNAVLSTIITLIKSLLSAKSFNRVHFAKCLSSEIYSQECQSFPMELFWRLHTCHVLSFNTYLACCSYNPSSCQAIAKGLTHLCNTTALSQQHKDRQENMLSVFLGVIVQLGYKEKVKEVQQKRTNLEKVNVL